MPGAVRSPEEDNPRQLTCPFIFAPSVGDEDEDEDGTVFEGDSEWLSGCEALAGRAGRNPARHRRPGSARGWPARGAMGSKEQLTCEQLTCPFIFLNLAPFRTDPIYPSHSPHLTLIICLSHSHMCCGKFLNYCHWLARDFIFYIYTHLDIHNDLDHF